MLLPCLKKDKQKINKITLPNPLPSVWASFWMAAGRTVVLGDQNQWSKNHADLHFHSDTRTRVPSALGLAKCPPISTLKTRVRRGFAYKEN